MTEVVTVNHIRNASGGILTESQLAKILKEIKTHPELKDKPEALVNKAFLEALSKHRAALKMMDGEAFPFELQFVVQACNGLAGDVKKKAGAAVSHAEKVVNGFKHMDGYTAPSAAATKTQSILTHEHKMNAGISFILAALSAVGAMSSARGMKTTDEQGVSHWNATAVGATLLQAALTAGMAYAGVHALRGAPVGRV